MKAKFGLFNILLGCCRLRALSAVCIAATSEVKNESSEAVAVTATEFNYFRGGDGGEINV